MICKTANKNFLDYPADEPNREDILKRLSRKNINHLTLFPDIYGAVEHANMQLKIKGYE
ncbi:MAG: hypothetical protein KAR05_00675 [Candidatus Omnitrophica bacterium]|nr:hypothetical protein [Candidatus Omnitrophota bacterium]